MWPGNKEQKRYSHLHTQ